MQNYVDGSFCIYGNDAAIYSDMYKDVYGCRPYYAPNFETFDDVEKEFACLQTMIDENQIFEDINCKRNFDTLMDRINALVAMGADTKRNALRWLIQSIDEKRINEDTVGFLFYHFGICQYDKYFKELKRIVGHF